MAKATNYQDQAGFQRRYRLLLRDAQEFAHHDRQAGEEEIRSGGEEARRVSRNPRSSRTRTILRCMPGAVPGICFTGASVKACGRQGGRPDGVMRRPLAPLPCRPNPTDPGDAADLSTPQGYPNRLSDAPRPPRPFFGSPGRRIAIIADYRRGTRLPQPYGINRQGCSGGAAFTRRPAPRGCGRRAWRDRAPGRRA